jgi:vitamin B12/bleomycin/antimicrobial peptide transport system ATP-binding/permease protein
MDRQIVPLRTTISRFVQAIRTFANSEVGWRAKLIFASLVGLLCGVNGLNVVNSYVGRNFMTAITVRNQTEFVRQAVFYVGVFAASTVVSVITRFAEERLALLWREFVTRRAVDNYLADATYYRLSASGKLEHPDQRITEDVRAFTVTTLSFVLMGLSSAFTIIAFSGVLWSISPLLLVMAVTYAASGSYLTILLGRPLMGLNYGQLDKEASFRSGLIHIRENAEAIMLAGREERQRLRLSRQLDDLIANFRAITVINRNVGFFTTGYGWLIQIIPVLIIAPAFIRGDVAFGVITQSAMAFSTLVAAFSLIVTQFQSLSNFGAVVARLSSLLSTIEEVHDKAGMPVELGEEEGHIAYERLTLLSPTISEVLLKDLSIDIPTGMRTLVAGSNEAGRTALFKATAGVSVHGTGRIIRPRAGNILFLAKRPYLPPGSLREVLLPSSPAAESDDEGLRVLLRKLDLDDVLHRAGDLDTLQDWEVSVSSDERQLLAFAHILLAGPQFVFLDGIGDSLDHRKLRAVLGMLSDSSIGYLVNAETKGASDLYDAVLDIDKDGSWTWLATRPDVQLTGQAES